MSGSMQSDCAMRIVAVLVVLSGLMRTFAPACFAGEKESPRQDLRETGDRVAAALFGNLGETEMRYYRPISLVATCLACHGKLEQISPSVLAAIRKIYPEDQAVGFQEGDLRGTVVVTFKAPGAVR